MSSDAAGNGRGPGRPPVPSEPPPPPPPEREDIHPGLSLDAIVVRLAEERCTVHHMRVATSDVWIFTGTQGRRLSAAAARAITEEKP